MELPAPLYDDLVSWLNRQQEPDGD